MDVFLGILKGNWIIVIIIAIMAWVASVYNSLVQLKVKVESAWSDVDTTLKKRYDLIPNLVETVKAYASHESETFNNVVDARTKASQMNVDLKNATPEQMVAFQQAEENLSKGIGKLFALAENYPDLKANQNFLDLQRQLNDVESNINLSRRYYNGTVKEFNTKVQMFPSNIIAKVFGFANKKFFELDSEEERKNVKVGF